MSGEVHARKRKDKRRRKEEDGSSSKEELSSKEESSGKDGSSSKEEEEVVEEHKHHDHHHAEAGTCSKLVFFILFAGLIAGASMIFIELHGSKDVDTPITASRYASILESFVDEHADDHGHEEEHHGPPDDHDEDQEEEDHPPEHQHSPQPEVIHEEPVVISKPVIEIESSPPPPPEKHIPPPPPPESRRVVREVTPPPAPPPPAESRRVVREVSPSPEPAPPAPSPPRREPQIVQEVSTPPPPPHISETETKPESRESYSKAHFTNDYDYEFREEIDRAEEYVDKDPEKARDLFEALLRKHPKSPRALFGKAEALNMMGHKGRLNALLEESIMAYRDVLDMENVPADLYMFSAEQCVAQMRFRGWVGKAIQVQRKMVKQFPGDLIVRNQLAVSHLLMGQNKVAKDMFFEILQDEPNDGFAQVHYGFILKKEYNNHSGAIEYMRKGIASGDPGTVDNRFFFQLGDSLTREGRPDEAYELYKKGVQHGLFRSVFQRSQTNVDGLTAKPWWKAEQTTYGRYVRLLEENWEKIRQEAIVVVESEELDGLRDENEGLRERGVWKQYELFQRGTKIDDNCMYTPITCKLIEQMVEAAECRRGQVKFSIMQPGTHIWPHTGPTNCRLRAHLGLVIPTGASMRVANETRVWQEGRVVIFDDSFEQEMWNDGDSIRIVLIVDFWHPELSLNQRESLTAI